MSYSNFYCRNCGKNLTPLFPIIGFRMHVTAVKYGWRDFVLCSINCLFQQPITNQLSEPKVGKYSKQESLRLDFLYGELRCVLFPRGCCDLPASSRTHKSPSSVIWLYSGHIKMILRLITAISLLVVWVNFSLGNNSTAELHREYCVVGAGPGGTYV